MLILSKPLNNMIKRLTIYFALAFYCFLLTSRHKETTSKPEI